METPEPNFTRNSASPKRYADCSPQGCCYAMGRKRPGHCGRCNAHGIKVPLAGSNHRFLCPFLRCACARCLRIEQDAARRRARHPRLAEQVRNIVANYTTSTSTSTSTSPEQDAQTPSSCQLEPRGNATFAYSSASPTSEHMCHSPLSVAPASPSRMEEQGERLPTRAFKSHSNSNSCSNSNCKNAAVSETISKPTSPLERCETSSAGLLAAAYLHSYAQWMTVLSAFCPPALCLPFVFPTPSLLQTPTNESARKHTNKQSEAASELNEPTIQNRFEETGRPFSSSASKETARCPRRISPIPPQKPAQEKLEVCDGLTIHTTPFVSS